MKARGLSEQTTTQPLGHLWGHLLVRLLLRFFEPFFELFLRGGTLPPAWRASERPMAMACLRLVTFLPERPERSVPLFISSMLRWTFLPAFLP